MFTLHYCPGACSTAAHIVAEELGVPYEGKPVSLLQGEQRSKKYLSVNPRGQVPALVVDGRVITETAAILFYLGRAFPDAGLLPRDNNEQARCLATLTWISSQVDPLFRRAVRPERVVEGEAACTEVRDIAQKGYWSKCQEVESLPSGNEDLAGSYTVCDPYALIYYGWGLRLRLPMRDLATFTALKDRLLARPAVQTVLEREKSPLLK